MICSAGFYLYVHEGDVFCGNWEAQVDEILGENGAGGIESSHFWAQRKSIGGRFLVAGDGDGLGTPQNSLLTQGWRRLYMLSRDVEFQGPHIKVGKLQP